MRVNKPEAEAAAAAALTENKGLAMVVDNFLAGFLIFSKWVRFVGIETEIEVGDRIFVWG
ncbi:hypothetical protein HanIR_Chr15g0779441 [Helianthus annuus]|nr:hypothetical protein HanIR_Chr15g0779441 [Helianthus annuus]